jgi:hypothetical protein
MKPPRFLINLYRDLQDRRLLPLVAVLVVAIPALPIALSQESEAPTTSPAPAVVADEDIPTLPAVLASDPGLRDYRKRLEALDSKNPFAQHFSGASEEAAEDAAVSKVKTPGGGTSDFSPPSTDPVAGAPPATLGSSSTSAGSSTSSSTVGTSVGSSGGSDGAPSSGSGQGAPEDGRWFTYRIDVTTGRAGDAEERKNVKRGTVLPSQSHPVALYLGAGEGGNRAQFLVSDDVVRTHGEGKCLPSPSDCQILTLKTGQERSFDFAPRGEPDTFVIKLDAIRLVEVDEPKGSGSESDDRQQKSASSGLKNFLGL